MWLGIGAMEEMTRAAGQGGGRRPTVSARAEIPPPQPAASAGATGLQYPPAPATLDDGPLVFLSAEQAETCARHEALRDLRLPCWAPQRRVGAALGHGPEGMEAAVASLGANYVWATELENVHCFWEWTEPAISVGGKRYGCSEAYYQSQKPQPFSDAVWDGQKERAMETAVRAKLEAAPQLADLLRARGLLLCDSIRMEYTTLL
eukprot:COSAG04_NODE_118_length_25039_cov_11.342783_3_plen_205_part_00